MKLKTLRSSPVTFIHIGLPKKEVSYLFMGKKVIFVFTDKMIDFCFTFRGKRHENSALIAYHISGHADVADEAFCFPRRCRRQRRAGAAAPLPPVVMPAAITTSTERHTAVDDATRR